MNALKRRVNKFYKYLPFAGLFLLTALLMIIFKTSDATNDALRQGKDAIIGFYTDNLVPIFDKNEITNEDIFNFAMYSRIPVDKEQNRILKIGEDQSGSKYFQVKPGEYSPDTKNLTRFEKFLQLDENEKERLNEILERYREELYSTVLHNENNTFAVDPNIELMRNSIAAELYQFAGKVNPERTTYLVNNRHYDISNNLKQLKTRIARADNSDKTNFIFFGPDTIFSQECDIDKSELKRLAKANAVAVAKSTSSSATAVSSSSSSKGARLKTATGVPAIKPVGDVTGLNMNVIEDDSKVIIPRGVFVDNFIGDRHSLGFSLDSLNNAINTFTLNLTSDSSGFLNFAFGEDGNNFNFNMDFNANDLNDIINAATSIASEKNVEKWENFGSSFDSMMHEMNIDINDSSVFINTNGFKFKINTDNNKKKSNKEKRD